MFISEEVRVGITSVTCSVCKNDRRNCFSSYPQLTLHHPLSHLTRMYLPTHRLQQEGRNFIEIFERTSHGQGVCRTRWHHRVWSWEGFSTQESVRLSYLRCLYQSINYALALTHFMPSSPLASPLHSSPTPTSFDLPFLPQTHNAVSNRCASCIRRHRRPRRWDRKSFMQ